MSLFLVATPIGNLQDISERAKHVITTVDALLCEDTRRTRSMCSALSLKAPRLISFHSHNERKKVGWVIEQLKSGKDMALVSDAGTPIVSDPGSELVKRAHSAKINVICVPGPSALTAALSVSGFSASPFHFLGFLPRKSGQRKAMLSKASHWNGVIVVFEAGNRFRMLISEIKELMPDREVCLCRELTKLHEEIIRAPVIDFSDEPVRGEVVLVIGPGSPVSNIEVELKSLKVISAALAKIWGTTKRDAYNALIKIRPETNERN